MTVSGAALFFGLVFLCAFGLTYIYKLLAVSLGLYDIPNHRSAHKEPVPIGAGLVFLACAGPAFYMVSQYQKIIPPGFLSLFLGGAFVCTTLGFVDDIKPLSAIKRLGVQLMLALWIMLELTKYFTVPFEVKFIPIDSVVISVVFGILFVMWMINLFNFMDGMDGFLGSQALLFSLGSAILSYHSGNKLLVEVYLVLSAVLSAFLVFNWRPAKIFMGDAGAYFLGFFFALFGLLGKIEFEQSLVSQVILMSMVICDATLTLIVRLLRTGRMFQGHRTHGFQKLKNQHGLRGSRVIGLYSAFTLLWCFPISLLALYNPNWSVLLCFVAYLPSLLFFAKLRVGFD